MAIVRSHYRYKRPPAPTASPPSSPIQRKTAKALPPGLLPDTRRSTGAAPSRRCDVPGNEAPRVRDDRVMK
jgi:hypothetical protein